MFLRLFKKTAKDLIVCLRKSNKTFCPLAQFIKPTIYAFMAPLILATVQPLGLIALIIFIIIIIWQHAGEQRQMQLRTI